MQGGFRPSRWLVYLLSLLFCICYSLHFSFVLWCIILDDDRRVGGRLGGRTDGWSVLDGAGPRSSHAHFVGDRQPSRLLDALAARWLHMPPALALADGDWTSCSSANSSPAGAGAQAEAALSADSDRPVLPATAAAAAAGCENRALPAAPAAANGAAAAAAAAAGQDGDPEAVGAGSRYPSGGSCSGSSGSGAAAESRSAGIGGGGGGGICGGCVDPGVNFAFLAYLFAKWPALPLRTPELAPVQLELRRLEESFKVRRATRFLAALIRLIAGTLVHGWAGGWESVLIACLPSCLLACLPTRLPASRPVRLSACVSACPPACLSAFLPACARASAPVGVPGTAMVGHKQPLLGECDGQCCVASKRGGSRGGCS